MANGFEQLFYHVTEWFREMLYASNILWTWLITPIDLGITGWSGLTFAPIEFFGISAIMVYLSIIFVRAVATGN